MIEDVRLAGIVLAGNAGNNPVSGLYPKATFRSVDIASVVSGGSRENGRMISVFEPLHGLNDHRLLQISSHSLSIVPCSSSVCNGPKPDGRFGWKADIALVSANDSRLEHWYRSQGGLDGGVRFLRAIG